MKRLARSMVTCAVLTLALVTGVGAGVGNAANAAVWSSSAQYASWSSNGYTLGNDVWGSGAGPQTIWANSSSNWGVWSQQPATNGVKSYPHAEYDFNRSLSAIGRISSSFNVSVPGSGVYNTAYDIWLNNYAYEVMLWMNEKSAGPLGSYSQTVSVGGYTWRLYSGSNGSNTVYSFVNTGQSSSGTVDVLAALNWLQHNGWFGGSTATLGNVQFGWEISSTGNTGTNFTTNSYSVSAG